MKRWHEDYHKFAYRQWKIHHRSHIESNLDNSRNRIGMDSNIVDCACDEQVGRFRKTDAWDCGKPHCMVCHSDKYPKRSKHEQELLSELDFREQLKELDDAEPKAEK